MAIRSSIHALHAYVPGEQPQGDRVVKLNTNENPYPPSPKVMEAMYALSSEDFRKYPEPSARPLREALAEVHGLQPENFLVVNGSDEGLALCTRCFCEHGGTVGYMAPSYSLYPILSDIAELQKVEYPLNPDFTWDVPESVEEDLFFLTRPNAPTSMSLPRAEVEQLLERCKGVLLVDEAYVAFASDSLMDLVGKVPDLLVSRTFSKSHGLAGMRVGYLAGPTELIEALNKIRDSYNVDAVAQRVAISALQDEAYMQDVVMKILQTRGRVAEELASRGFDLKPSDTNFLFARVPAGSEAKALFEALKARNVFVRYFPGETTGDYIRITIGTDDEMDHFLSELDACLSS